MSPRPAGKDYLLLSWLDFGTWDLTAAKMLLNFTGQMVRAPPGSFLAELLAELRRDCELTAWLCGVLRLLSRIIFPTFCLSRTESRFSSRAHP